MRSMIEPYPTSTRGSHVAIPGNTKEREQNEAHDDVGHDGLENVRHRHFGRGNAAHRLGKPMRAFA